MCFNPDDLYSGRFDRSHGSKSKFQSLLIIFADDRILAFSGVTAVMQFTYDDLKSVLSATRFVINPQSDSNSIALGLFRQVAQYDACYLGTTHFRFVDVHDSTNHLGVHAGAADILPTFIYNKDIHLVEWDFGSLRRAVSKSAWFGFQKSFPDGYRIVGQFCHNPFSIMRVPW